MKIHFIDKGNDQYLLFVPQTLKFFNVNGTVKNVVTDIENGISKEEIISKYSISEETFLNLYNTIYAEPIEEFNPDREGFLSKLVLNVTNKCNLDCKYCYACGGSYGSSECMMDIPTAKLAIDTVLQKYNVIQSIQFFGGEPLLNEPVIRFVCEYFTKLVEEKKLAGLPAFGTISNGTIYSDQLAETIKKYQIGLTFSIDGPKSVHDSMRIYKEGTGSFDKVIENIEKYRNAGVPIVGAETTYNINHVNQKLSVMDTIRYLKDELQISDIHLVPASGDDSADYKIEDRSGFVDSVSEIFKEKVENKKEYTYSFVGRILEALKWKKSNCHLCMAGITQFSVSSKGDIYPCFLFTDMPEFRLGNVYDKVPFFENETFTAQKSRFSGFSKYQYPKCKDCFNNRICSGCIGANYFATGDVFETSDLDCDMQRALTEQVLIALSNISNKR